MNRLYLAALPLALMGCATLPSVPTSPGVVADSTILDEQTALATELAYQAAATALLTATRAGIIPASAKPAVRAADQRAYAAVLAVRAAYLAGNASGYAAAVAEARGALTAFLTAIKG